jgi:uncharacterized protein (DUF2267 family)
MNAPESTMTQPYDVVHASKLFQDWLAALKDRALLQTHNQSQAMFRAVLHQMRRHMTTAQVLAFADALPPLPRGIFLEGWRPASPVPLASPREFSAEVVQSLSAHHSPPNSIVSDVFGVLAERSEPQNAQLMRQHLPEALRSLWPG